ncbi:hypothetical protein Q4511_12080 [Paracoccus sp. 1_MG-2023]|uniref:hypothetical protein n=1 Tax=unclassified Paracoccus (in: a-proteobacteria) TaxID=2688777 RepID=UPI001C084FE2|nr:MULTISPECIES: hypothetical protein [unclassified Paracoccus (in: a-proteobacteria)]MBU2957462.1 hypothetical protein [Paracoccus sp. C2R09]MDO6669660.1 hypothetical protein [Paracoccus sp. 1_MG-2023]
MAVDWMRLLLAAFVVLAHSGLGRETVGLADLSAGNSILRVAVPTFTLIAGYFLESTLQRGRMSRWAGSLLTLYAAWSALYILFLWPYYAARPVSVTARELVLGFMHLWFLLGLAMSGMMLAVARHFGVVAVVASALIFAGTGFYLQHARMGAGVDLDLEMYRNGPFYLYPYLVMGWLIARTPPARLPAMPILGLMLAAGLALSMWETGFWLERRGEDPLLEMPVGHLLMCPALFLLVMRLPMPPSRLPLGRAAAGIYVMHVIFLQGLPMIGIDDLALRAAAGFLLPLAIVVGAVAVGPRLPILGRLF